MISVIQDLNVLACSCHFTNDNVYVLNKCLTFLANMDKHDDLDNDSTHELQKLQQDMVDVPVVKFSDESADADLNDSDPVISGMKKDSSQQW